ncbi:MAG: MMPL family transporter [Rhodopirellula sp.]|nr:MMPL family transporter [Rhodopirellula sp.]
MLLATYLFRNLAAVAIACLPPLAGAFWTMGGMGLVGEPVNTLNSIVPALVLVVGFTDAVHLLLEIRRERTRGRTARGAAAASLRCLMLPCFLTSATTAVGFASLAVAQLEIVRRFGLTCAAGALINFAAVVPLVPYLSTTWLGRSLGSRVPDEKAELRLERALGRLVHALLGRARLVAIAGFVLTLLLLTAAFQLRPDNHLRAGIPNGTASYEALRYCDESFGGVMYSYVVVEWPREEELGSVEVLRALGDIHQLLAEQEQLGPPFSVLNLLQSLPHRSGQLQTAVRYLDAIPPKMLNKLVREEQRLAVVMAQTPDRGARALEPVFTVVEEQLRNLAADYPGFRFRLTGSTVVSARNVNLIIEDLVSSLGLAALIILATLTVAFRSLRFGLMTLIPNVLPLAAAGAVLWLRGDGLEVQAVITFSICLGVAVDDTIHVLNRFVRGVAEGADTRSAIESATVRAGYALTITTLTMLGGFGSGLFSALPVLRVFSLLSCIALLSALAASLVLLPALLSCFRPETVPQSVSTLFRGEPATEQG